MKEEGSSISFLGAALELASSENAPRALNGSADRWPDECRNFLKSPGLVALWPTLLFELSAFCGLLSFHEESIALVHTFVGELFFCAGLASSRRIIPWPFTFLFESLILLERFFYVSISFLMGAQFASFKMSALRSLMATSWCPSPRGIRRAMRWTRKRSDRIDKSSPIYTACDGQFTEHTNRTYKRSNVHLVARKSSYVQNGAEESSISLWSLQLFHQCPGRRR